MGYWHYVAAVILVSTGILEQVHRRLGPSPTDELLERCLAEEDAYLCWLRETGSLDSEVVELIRSKLAARGPRKRRHGASSTGSEGRTFGTEAPGESEASNETPNASNWGGTGTPGTFGEVWRANCAVQYERRQA